MFYIIEYKPLKSAYKLLEVEVFNFSYIVIRIACYCLWWYNIM
ncbi:hypothetical protein HMPREF3183_00463 [Peptostreptococcus anaerobius]|nr:hypothetical protein HMPREF3183_00463 [Peptostreptococcus anaerobius]